MGESRPQAYRPGLRRLSTAAIAYGIIGLVIAVLGLLALFWVNGKVGNIAGQIETSVDQLTTTTERSAKALHDAAATADSFSTTLTSTTDAVAATSASIDGVATDLKTLQDQLAAFSILGATPLTTAANAVGRISDSLAGIETRLQTIADSLAGNTDKLAANATSLGALGDSLDTLAARLGSGTIESSLDDLQTVLMVTFVVFAAWTAVPAAGALVFGLWLRRMLARTGA